MNEDVATAPFAPPEPHEAPEEAHSHVISSASDRGPGTLRDCLERLQVNTTATFDAQVFDPKNPATIRLASPLPAILSNFTALDASNAGVILDSGGLTEGDGIRFRASHCRIMGLQILNFPRNEIRAEGDWDQIGGNRSVGTGPPAKAISPAATASAASS
ncbi:MAG: hypothetical protein GX592_12910 [Clostridiales bacterium]|nr:hypothetical protein [Clostridiales bacterium]